MSKVTIRRVAQIAGVSPMTVSRVLNDRPDVSSETRKRVLEVIEQLDYAPNAAARSLSQGRSNTIGVVTSGIQYFGPSAVLVGIEKASNQVGYSLRLNLLHDPEADPGISILNELIAQQVDGILWAIPEIGENRTALCKRVSEISTPLVFLDMAPRDGAMVATTDNYSGGRLATQHLIDQGFQNIGIITGPTSWWSANQRKLGWQEALADAGYSSPESYCVNGDWSAASGESGMRQLLQQAPTLDAVFVCNDQMALGALKTLRQVNVRVPEDIAIVGYDATPEAEYYYPTLTTVDQGVFDMGATAVDLLHQILMDRRRDKETKPTTRWIEPRLVIRESSEGRIK